MRNCTKVGISGAVPGKNRRICGNAAHSFRGEKATFKNGPRVLRSFSCSGRHGVRCVSAGRGLYACGSWTYGRDISAGVYNDIGGVPAGGQKEARGYEKGRGEILRKDRPVHRPRRYGEDVYKRQFLYRTAAAAGAGKIATAHTADDNAETVLMDIMRGSGIRGLAGIPPVRDIIIRPVLFAERNEVESYLRKKGVGYVTDSSNERCV